MLRFEGNGVDGVLSLQPVSRGRDQRTVRDWHLFRPALQYTRFSVVMFWGSQTNQRQDRLHDSFLECFCSWHDQQASTLPTTRDVCLRQAVADDWSGHSCNSTLNCSAKLFGLGNLIVGGAWGVLECFLLYVDQLLPGPQRVSCEFWCVCEWRHTIGKASPLFNPLANSQVNNLQEVHIYIPNLCQ